MKTLMLRGYAFEKKNGEADPLVGGVHIPVGSKVVAVGPNDDGSGFVLLAMVQPNAARVWHPLIIAPIEQAVEMPIGRELGDALGVVPTPFGPAAVFPLLPWPKSALEAMTAEGNG